jgi:hypothetical protein
LDKNLGEKVAAVIALSDTDAGQTEIAEHVFTMFGAVFPTVHHRSRRIFVSDGSRYICAAIKQTREVDLR